MISQSFGWLAPLLLGTLFWAPLVFGQGVASRGVKPMPRSKPSGLPFHARFEDVAKEAGLRAPVVYGGIDRKDYIIETVGCGAAFLDYDDDGWTDIFLLSGTRLGEPAPGAGNRLYRNTRDGAFTDVTKQVGLAHSGWASSVAVGDYDNDGLPDLFVTYWGQNALYRNRGKSGFEEVTKRAGLLGERTRWGAGATFLDYDRDGRLDLFVSYYLDFDIDKAPSKGSGANCNWKGIPVNCGPRGLPPETPSLYHNNGDGTFRDVTKAAGIAEAFPGYGMTAVAADFDADGWPDIYLASDSTPSLLFRNNRDGTFSEEGLERGVALSEDGVEQAGMGVGVGDFDLDGDLDILKTHFSDDTNVLYRNEEGHFDDVTIESGLGVETRFVSWGAAIADLDNDGLPDLFYVTGSVYPEVEAKLPDYPYHTPRVVFRNLGRGKFEELIEEAGPGVAARHASRGAALGDYDNDGDLDILIVNLNEPPSLLRNDSAGTANHAIQVKLIGTESNRSAIGARVTVRYGEKQQTQEVLSQSSFYSVSDQRLHFGLGSVQVVDLEIRWPNGKRESIAKVAAGQLVTIEEGRGIVDRRRFAAAAPQK